jgi:hypothetical protein
MKLHAPDTDPKRTGDSLAKQWMKICENEFGIPKSDKISEEEKLAFSKSAMALDEEINLGRHPTFQPNRTAAPSAAAAATLTTSTAAGTAQAPTTSTATGAAQAPTSTTKRTHPVSIVNRLNKAPRHKRSKKGHDDDTSTSAATTTEGASPLESVEDLTRTWLKKNIEDGDNVETGTAEHITRLEHRVTDLSTNVGEIKGSVGRLDNNIQSMGNMLKNILEKME